MLAANCLNRKALRGMFRCDFAFRFSVALLRSSTPGRDPALGAGFERDPDARQRPPECSSLYHRCAGPVHLRQPALRPLSAGGEPDGLRHRIGDASGGDTEPGDTSAEARAGPSSQQCHRHRHHSFGRHGRHARRVTGNRADRQRLRSRAKRGSQLGRLYQPEAQWRLRQ